MIFQFYVRWFYLLQNVMYDTDFPVVVIDVQNVWFSNEAGNNTLLTFHITSLESKNSCMHKLKMAKNIWS